MKLAIFDMDGTLVDSMASLEELAVASINHEFKIPSDTIRRFYRDTVGKPFRQQLSLFLPRMQDANPGALDRVADSYAAVHAKLAPSFAVTPLAREIQDWSKHAYPDLRFGLVTSTAREIVDKMTQINRTWLDEIDGFSQQPGGDKRGQILGMMSRRDVTVHDCIYVGDSPSDAKLASQLGIKFVPHTACLSAIIKALYAPYEYAAI